MRAKPVSPAQAGLPLPGSPAPRVARTGASGDKSTPGGGFTNPAPSPRATPRRPEVDKAGDPDVAIYELTGPFTTWAWLDRGCLQTRYIDQGWTAKRLPGAVDRCDRCGR
jgi:hypothetical protein